MKRFLAFGLLLAALGAPVLACSASAQTVIDGSDKKASPFVKNTLKTLTKRFPDTHPFFRAITTHPNAEKKQVVCGEISLSSSKTPEPDSFMLFGATEGENAPIVYEPREIPPSIDSREVNLWINHGADLADLEEMSCVPEGSYRQYGDKLNQVLQNKKHSATR